METNRRQFLRTLFFGTAAVAAAPLIPKGTVYSFLGGIFKRKRELWIPGPYLGSDYFTIADIVKRYPLNYNVAKIADLLNQPNDILDDIPWMPENHAVTIRDTGSVFDLWNVKPTDKTL